jgi:hypothetical protein
MQFRVQRRINSNRSSSNSSNFKEGSNSKLEAPSDIRAVIATPSLNLETLKP